MSTIDEDERERKPILSIVPSSSFSNFPGLASDPQNGHHYHHQPPPLSAVSGVSASMFSDLLSEAGASSGGGVDVGEEPSPEELQKEDPLAIQMWRLYARTKANLPHAQRMENLTWRMVGMALRRKIQLEEQMQGQPHPQRQYLHDQLMQMKQEDEEHKVVPVDEQGDVPVRGRRLQKFSGSVSIPDPTAGMTSTSASTITRVKARMRVEGFEMPEDADADGCVFLFFISDGPCTDVMVWCTGSVKRKVWTKGWSGMQPRARSHALAAQGREWGWEWG